MPIEWIDEQVPKLAAERQSRMADIPDAPEPDNDSVETMARLLADLHPILRLAVTKKHGLFGEDARNYDRLSVDLATDIGRPVTRAQAIALVTAGELIMQCVGSAT